MSYAERLNGFNQAISSTNDHVKALRDALNNPEIRENPIKLGLETAGQVTGTIGGVVGGVARVRDSAVMRNVQVAFYNKLKEAKESGAPQSVIDAIQGKLESVLGKAPTDDRTPEEPASEGATNADVGNRAAREAPTDTAAAPASEPEAVQGQLSRGASAAAPAEDAPAQVSSRPISQFARATEGGEGDIAGLGVRSVDQSQYDDFFPPEAPASAAASADSASGGASAGAGANSNSVARAPVAEDNLEARLPFKDLDPDGKQLRRLTGLEDLDRSGFGGAAGEIQAPEIEQRISNLRTLMGNAKGLLGGSGGGGGGGSSATDAVANLLGSSSTASNPSAGAHALSQAQGSNASAHANANDPSQQATSNLDPEAQIQANKSAAQGDATANDASNASKAATAGNDGANVADDAGKGLRTATKVEEGLDELAPDTGPLAPFIEVGSLLATLGTSIASLFEKKDKTTTPAPTKPGGTMSLAVGANLKQGASGSVGAF